ncbi:DUF4365 domain-containing protein [Leptospira kanakyensis]|uniref:DUF4365 domain-containing protein n=1 Tax=Leptospira kanakyensis TaxID=2484968 RepID=UPI00223CA0CE|nr:DUF4365 domain-containing protein [Leptospira kanakyensis]MCW7471781.1 DUF4365 domain-containing protein [Leptospira kanakyensis]
MHITSRKELFSLAYIKALTSRLGFNPGTFSIDNDSADICFTVKNHPGRIKNPQIHFQLKCTTIIPSKQDFIDFPLPIKNYNDLRGENVLCPRYLIIITIPKDEEEWITVGDDNLILKHSGYFYSLKHCPETDNEDNIRIKVPLSNKLSLKILAEMMDKASELQSL